MGILQMLAQWNWEQAEREEKSMQPETRQLQHEPQQKPIKKTKQSKLWPFDNNIDISTLSRREQHERELAIQNAMEIFSCLPFRIGDTQLIRPNVSMREPNMTETQIIQSALVELSGYIETFYNSSTAILDNVPRGLRIPIENLNRTRTHIEYWPFTNAGNYTTSYPLKVSFSTVDEPHIQPLEATGCLEWGLDGSVCHATIRLFADKQCFCYTFGIIGRTFLITGLEMTARNGMKGLLYDSKWDFMDWR